MKRLVLISVLSLLASSSVVATFEVDDPVQAIEDLHAAQMVENANKHTGLIQLEKRDYLKLIVSTYVNGFKEFDTTVVTFDDSVSVGIYYDSTGQDQQRADQLAKRFRENIPPMLEPYKWAKNIKVIVSVYGEERER